MSNEQKDARNSFAPDMATFIGLTIFMTVVALVYMTVSHMEPIGSTLFVLLAAMMGMVAVYLFLLSRRIPVRPEDKLTGEIDEATGEIGVFAPTSWWPLIAGVGAALAFLAVAIGWWIMVPAVIVAAIGTIGMVMEFSVGKHAH